MIGFLLSVTATLYLFALTGEPGMYLDLPFIVYLIAFIYGLSVFTFGPALTWRSVSALAHLFRRQNTSADPTLAKLIKTQIHFALLAASIAFCQGLIALFNLADNLADVGPALALQLLILLYPAVLIGFLYYPAYLKLSSGQLTNPGQ